MWLSGKDVSASETFHRKNGRVRENSPAMSLCENKNRYNEAIGFRRKESTWWLVDALVRELLTIGTQIVPVDTECGRLLGRHTSNVEALRP